MCVGCPAGRELPGDPPQDPALPRAYAEGVELVVGTATDVPGEAQ